MIIILEGPDGSGKTTLANKLAKQTGYPIIHFTRPTTEEETQAMFDEYFKLVRKTKNAILDRCWYSEMVYGPVMRGVSHIAYPQMYALEEQLCRNGAMLIYCTGPQGVLWDRCQARGEDYVLKWEQFSSICDGFDTVMFGVPHLIPVASHVYKEV